MSSLLTDNEKIQVREAFENLHDTFKQTINVYIEESVSITNSENYNSIYGRYKDQSKSLGDKTLKKYPIQARVHYFKKSEDAMLDGVGLPSSANVIRLKVDADGLTLLNKSSFVEVDGNKCQVISNPESVGPFVSLGALFYKVYLKVDT